jgi:hypothetical protein
MPVASPGSRRDRKEACLAADIFEKVMSNSTGLDWEPVTRSAQFRFISERAGFAITTNTDELVPVSLLIVGKRGERNTVRGDPTPAKCPMGLIKLSIA